MPAPSNPNRSGDSRWLSGGAMVVVGGLATAWHLLGLLRDEQIAQNLVTHGLWRALTELFGGTPRWSENQWHANLDGTVPLIAIVAVACCAWLLGAAVIARRGGGAWREALGAWGL